MSSFTEDRTRSTSDEPDAHIVSRHFRTGVRLLLAMSLIATIVCLLFLRKAAYVAAIPIPLLYVVLAFTNYLEIRSRASNLRSPGQSRISPEETEIDIETAGIVTLMKVVGALAIATFIIAASVFEWQLVGVSAAALLFLAVLINLPYLPLFFTESERDERDRLREGSR